MKKRDKKASEKAKESAPAAVQTADRSLPSPLAPAEDAALTGLWYELRDSMPVIDACVLKLVRLTGGFRVRCAEEARERLDDFIENVPVNGNCAGLAHFMDCYFEQLLTCGTAVGEIVTDGSGLPAGLYNAPLGDLEFFREENGFDVGIAVRGLSGSRRIAEPGLIVRSVLNPRPGRLCGTSLLSGLPFISETLGKIFRAIGANWDRLGNVRFAVTYDPPGGSAERAFAGERAKTVAREWSRAMSSDGVRDFVAVGDVKIRAIGADCAFPDSETPVRQLIEQITAKTGIPPFMLGLSWSSTERMSDRQADILTTELWSYRRLLAPVIEKICGVFLERNGFDSAVSVEWDEITLQDELAERKKGGTED